MTIDELLDKLLFLAVSADGKPRYCDLLVYSTVYRSGIYHTFSVDVQTVRNAS
jgi:hypothetical protein